MRANTATVAASTSRKPAAKTHNAAREALLAIARNATAKGTVKYLGSIRAAGTTVTAVAAKNPSAHSCPRTRDSSRAKVNKQ